MDDEKLTMLLQHCSHYPALFNKISNILYNDFGQIGSVPALLVVWIETQHTFFYDEGELKMFERHVQEEV